LQRRLQSVINAAAQLVFSARRSEHISPLLHDLHWLKVLERIKFHVCVLTYRCLHSIVPSYLAETLHLSSSVASSTPFWINIDITCTCTYHTTNYTWRSSIASGCCMGPECSAGVCQNYWVVHCIQATDKNAAVQGIFQRSPNMIAPVVTVAVTADM